MTLDTFAHIVAHDLKAPLNGIASMVEFVVEDYADRLDDEGRAQLQMIQAMAVRGVAMVDGLRQLTRVTSATLSLRRLDMAALATRALAELAAGVDADEVSTHVATPLPAPLGDPALVPLLVGKLCANALRFHRASAGRRVALGPLVGSSRPIPDGVVGFAVTDNGIGIPERHRTEIFDIFKRLHAVDAFGGGVGAGLAIAKVIAERHGGEIWVERGDPGATVIAFTLPAAPADAVPARTA